MSDIVKPSQATVAKGLIALCVFFALAGAGYKAFTSDNEPSSPETGTPAVATPENSVP